MIWSESSPSEVIIRLIRMVEDDRYIAGNWGAALPWLIRYLMDGAEEDTDPNSDIVVVLGDDDVENDGADSGTGIESTSDPVVDNPGKGKKK